MLMKEFIVPVDESTLEQDELEWFKEQGAKELIRCKDCKFAEFCEIAYRFGEDGDWFCADGQRK